MRMAFWVFNFLLSQSTQRISGATDVFMLYIIAFSGMVTEFCKSLHILPNTCFTKTVVFFTGCVYMHQWPYRIPRSDVTIVVINHFVIHLRGAEFSFSFYRKIRTLSFPLRPSPPFPPILSCPLFSPPSPVGRFFPSLVPAEVGSLKIER